jgi:hypothetical protein
MGVGRTDERTVIEKRLEVITGARLRDRSRIEKAISIQDRLREKSKGWNGAKEIRKWRESR